MPPHLVACVIAICLAAQEVAGCSSRFMVPPRPAHATQYNGIHLPDTCFYTRPTLNHDGFHHIYAIGDWGGIIYHPWNHSFYGPVAADHRSFKNFPKKFRPFVYGADDFAQEKIARLMAARAAYNEPDYIINVGDNFYWGGIEQRCGAPLYAQTDRTGQWESYEMTYTGPGIDGKQWLGVLGNHDYGGYKFQAGWDQAIGYTWLRTPPSTNRWLTPAQYYRSTVHYSGFSIDYFFVDTNVFDTWDVDKMQQHNICSKIHNKDGVSCGATGPTSPEDCRQWFLRLWSAEVAWLQSGLSQSKADWQIVVGHHPPEGYWGGPTWQRLARNYGIDLMITGHRHRQEVHYMHDFNPIKPTAYIVTGGGGGITSDGDSPRTDGNDDEYGFIDLTLSKWEIMIEAISHGGITRSTTCVRKSHPGGRSENYAWKGRSLCNNHPHGPYHARVNPYPIIAKPQPVPVPSPPPVTAATTATENAQEPRFIIGLKKILKIV